MQKHKLLLILLIPLFVLLLLGVAAFLIFKPSTTSGTSNNVRTVSELETIETKLKYDNAYNGPLFAASEKTGSEGKFEKLFENMDRNGVNHSVLYFGYEAEGGVLDLFDDELNGIIKANKIRPGRVITFYSTGIGGQSEGEMAGDELLGIYKNGFEKLEELAPGMVRGIGEIELYAWEMDHNDKRVLQLFDFAAEKGLNIMFHPGVGKLSQVEDILERYPNTTFIMHMFHPDFRVERQNVEKLLGEYENLYYTIDADHLMFDKEAKIGLLYKYQDDDIQKAKQNFLMDYERKSELMLATDIELFGPMVEKFPDKVIWGTEMHEEYTYEPEVYDKMIELSRRFIGNFSPSIQEKLGFSNAQKVFGFGVVIE